MDTESGPIEKLTAGLAGMTNAQKVVAEYIIHNPVNVAFMTLDQFAGNIDVSTATIMRVMYYLGYSGYAEFQRILQAQLRNQMSPGIRLEANLRDKSAEGENVWVKCRGKQLQNITDTFATIPVEDLDGVAADVIKARRVYFVTARGGMMIATYLHDFLKRMFAKCQIIHADIVTDWCTVIPDLNESDLVIAISFPRYAKKIGHFLRLSKEKGARNVLFTDSHSSPWAKYADVLLPCVCASLGFHNSPVSAMMIADCIINVISLQYAGQVRERLDLASKILTEDDYYTI